MKALIRNDGETVKETDGVIGIDWNNGEPLTRPEWAGGPYTLVEDYVEPEDPEHTPVVSEIVTLTDPSQLDNAVVTINGKEYTKSEIEELRRSLNL